MRVLRGWLSDVMALLPAERVVDLAGRQWKVQNGTEFASAVLAHGAIRVLVAREGLATSSGGVNADVTVELGSQACHQELGSWQGAWRYGKEIATELLERAPAFAKLSRVDPCVDVTDIDFARIDRDLWVTDLRASKRRGPDGVADDDWLVWYTGSHPNSFLWGARASGACARVYDKVLEIRQKSRKVWFGPMWAQNNEGVIPANVWRVEFELKRKKLKGEVWPDDLRGMGPHLTVDTVEGLERALPFLWRLYTEERLRLCEPRGANRSRWPLRADWLDVVVNVDWKGNAVPGGLWIPGRQREADLAKTLPQVIGQAIRAAALRRGAGLRDSLGGGLADLAEFYLAERGRDWLSEVRAKMAELGVEPADAVVSAVGVA